MRDSSLVIDSSAFVAILQAEMESAEFIAAIRTASKRLMSSGTYLECAMVALRWQGGREELDAWLTRESIEVVPVDLGSAQIAADAFARFGKGRHPAGLNYGDCFAYALANSRSARLLFKGADFGLTDIEPAVP